MMAAEVEFGSEDAAEAFEPHDWFASEATDDARFKNQSWPARARAGGPSPGRVRIGG